MFASLPAAAYSMNDTPTLPPYYFCMEHYARFGGPAGQPAAVLRDVHVPEHKHEDFAVPEYDIAELEFDEGDDAVMGKGVFKFPRPWLLTSFIACIGFHRCIWCCETSLV